MLGGPVERTKLTEAAHLVREALELLDSVGAPADVGAHLDHALCRLESLAGEAEAQTGSVSETASR